MNTASLEAPLHRIRRGKAICFGVTPHAPAPLSARVPRIARMLALAHAMQRLLDRRAVRSRAELAIVTGFTPARITQLLDLTLIAPDIQEELLFASASCGRALITERSLRDVVRCRNWADQRYRWQCIRSASVGRSYTGDREGRLRRAVRP